MKNHLKLTVVALAGLSLVACGNASFFGGGSSKKTVQTSPETQPTVNPPPGSQTPSNQNQTPGSNGATPQVGPQNQVSQPNPNTIVFGKDQVFHIGDGRFDNTSCKEQVAELPLTGNAYFFQFEVLNDNTVITVNTAKLCGVDYGTNTYELYASMSRIQGQFIPRAQTTLTSAQIPLRRGVYTVVLASGLGRDSGELRSDKDDFIVGNVVIQGSNAVRPMQYGAFMR